MPWRGVLVGAVAGALAVVPPFNLLVPRADILGSEHFPAPGVQVWASVSRLLSQGASQLAPAAQQAILIGLAALGFVARRPSVGSGCS